MKKFLLAASIVSCTFGSTSFAAPTLGGPATGLWAHVGDGGRGFNIDIQGDIMVVNTFVFKATGEPIWYLSSGIYNHKTGVFHSSYDSYSGGQCFGCPTTQPTVHSGAAGAMVIQFHDNQHATLQTPSGPLEIQKLNYGFASENDLLYGEWMLSMNVSGLYGGDWIVFTTPYTGSDGTIYAAGQTDDPLRRVALGTWSRELNAYVVLVQSGNYYHFYKISLDDHRGVGAGWVYLKTQSPVGNGSPVFAARAMYRSEISAPKMASGDAAASIDKDESALAASDDGYPVSADVVEQMRKMQQEMAAGLAQ